MELTTLLAFATLSQVSAPVLWLQPDGNITLRGQEIRPHFSVGTKKVRTSGPVAFDFDGKRSGILFGDLKPLALTNTEATLMTAPELSSFSEAMIGLVLTPIGS